MAAHGTKAIVAALLANAGIAVAKFVAFVVTGSASMLAEGVHSVADSGNQGLLLLGGRRARKQPTPSHPFGYARERYFWAFVVAVVLFTLGSAFAVLEGIEKIRHPHELESPAWAIGVLLLGLVLESISFRTAIVEANTVRAGRPWWTYIRRAKSPEIPVVLLEDLGALLGLLIALAAVGTSIATDDAVWDGIGTLTIGILLGLIAIVLAAEMKSLLIGESASPAVLEQIRAVVDADADTTKTILVETQHLGPDDLLVAAKVAFADTLDTRAVSAAINRIEDALRAEIPEAQRLFIEPDMAR